MTNGEILNRIDHTLLKAASSWAEIAKLCGEGIDWKTASVCIPPSYVKQVFRVYGKRIPVCTVIGFPLGYSITDVKIREAEEALKDGADELDMVINIGDVKNGAYDKVLAEISALKKTAGTKILKVIVETCYLTQDEKIRLCQIVTEAGADYIKTSTGLGPSGAAMEDIFLFKEHIGSSVKMKAAGGIRTREDMEKYISAGCARIGTSSAGVLAGGNN
jgi:deoxyribose-phosphate aldolase